MRIHATRSRPTLAFTLAAAALGGCWDAAPGERPDPPAPDGAAWDAPGDLVAHDPWAAQGVHITWRRDPSTTLTFTWLTDGDVGYAPLLRIAEAAACGIADGVVSLPDGEEYVHVGAAVPWGTETSPRIAWVVEVTGLAPDTEYYYELGTWPGSAGAWPGAPHVLGPLPVRTGKAPSGSGPFSFVVAGDNQGALDDLADHLAPLASTDAAFWLFTGDLVSSGTPANYRRWLATLSPVLTARPAMPVRGNHEYAPEPFYGLFPVPVEPDLDPALAGRAWSLDYGGVHVVGLDSVVSADAEAIAAWLDADLAAADADPSINWKVVYFHHPAYSASPAHGSTARVIESWVPVFEAHGVDLVFSGHDHDYERSCPVAAGACAAPGEGVTYVVVGGFFASLYTAGADWWTAYSEKTDCYALVEVDGDTLHLTALDPNDQSVIDELVLEAAE